MTPHVGRLASKRRPCYQRPSRVAEWSNHPRRAFPRATVRSISFGSSPVLQGRNLRRGGVECTAVSWRASGRTHSTSPCSSIPRNQTGRSSTSSEPRPGRMALTAVVLVAALLAVGVTASTMVSDRQKPAGDPAIAHRTAGRCGATDLRGSLVRQHDRRHRVPVRRRRTARCPRSLRRRHRAGVRRPGHRLERGVAQRYSLADAAHRPVQPAGAVHRDRGHCSCEQPRRTPDRSRLPQRIVRC